MANITMEMIKELREKTGVGISKCKEALESSSGDLQEAITYLRKAGIASAVKKGGRDTNEGMIAIVEHSDCVVAVEVNSETDFVSQNDTFKDFVKNLADEIAHTKPSDVDSFLKQSYSKDSSMTVDEYRATAVQTVGENLQLHRFEVFEKSPEVSVGFYSHMGGKMAAVVVAEPKAGFEAVCKDLAMQAVAADPAYLNPEEVSEEVKEREREIIRDQIQNKPPEIQNKIVEGKLNAFYEQSCLTRQKYVKDPSITIEKLLANEAKDGVEPKPVRFIRWQIGG